MLYFNEQLQCLNNFYFLDPTWLCDVLSQVLTDTVSVAMVTSVVGNHWIQITNKTMSMVHCIWNVYFVDVHSHIICRRIMFYIASYKLQESWWKNNLSLNPLVIWEWAHLYFQTLLRSMKGGKIPLSEVQEVYLKDSRFPNENVPQYIQLLEQFEIALKVESDRKWVQYNCHVGLFFEIGNICIKSC